MASNVADLANNLSVSTADVSQGVNAGIGLSQAADKLQNLQLQNQQANLEIQQKQVSGALSMANTYLRADPEVRKKMRPVLGRQSTGFGLDVTPFLDVVDSKDPAGQQSYRTMLQDPAFLKQMTDNPGAAIAALGSGDLFGIENHMDTLAKVSLQNIQAQRDEKKLANQAAISKAENESRERAAQIRADGQTAGNDRKDTTAANGLLKDPNISKETLKLNAAGAGQELLSAIGSGKVVASKNISRQLTNMIATIEMGSPGGQGDRDSVGVDTLYTRAKALQGFVQSNPEAVIPPEYLTQLGSEIQTLGNRAYGNYKKMTDAKIATAGDSNVGTKARAQADTFLSGYAKAFGQSGHEEGSPASAPKFPRAEALARARNAIGAGQGGNVLSKLQAAGYSEEDAKKIYTEAVGGG